MTTAELATSYAALILADDGVEITVRNIPPGAPEAGQRQRKLTSSLQADKIQTLLKAAKVEDVEPIWAQLFAKVRPSIDPARAVAARN